MECKYYDKHLETIKEYIGCLYNLDGCSSGGPLHILLDDDNYDDDDIAYCLKACLTHPERECSKLGVLICEEYLKLPMTQRRLLSADYIGHWTCRYNRNCDECEVECGYGYEDE